MANPNRTETLRRARAQPRVTIHNRQRTRVADTRRLRKIAQTLLAERLQVHAADLGIYLVAEPEMTRLNETFLRHQGSTDVITFDYAENDGQASCLPKAPRKREMNGQHTRPVLHGEIFICVDEAVLQARKHRTNWQSEVVRYLIHGVLHLLGYDDHRSGDRRKMKRAENQLLRHFSRRISLAQPGQPIKLGA